MGVREVLAALGRRWYVLVVGLVLTVSAGWYFYESTPPDYSARSLVLLLPPEGTGENAGSNPFLELGGLELTARVLAATYSGTAFVDEIAERSETAEVEVALDESTRGGVIAVSVKDRGEEQTMDLLGYVTGTVSERLAGLQSEVGVDDQDTVRSMLLAQDTVPEPDFQSLTRILVIVIGAGIAVTVVTAVLLDVLVDRHSRRRSGMYVRRSSRERRNRTAPIEPDVAYEPSDEEDSAERATPTDASSQPALARRAVPGRVPKYRDDAVR